MFVNEPLFPTPHQHGVMYLMLPVRDERFTKTEIKIGWATDIKRQRDRNKKHKQSSPGIESVAIWPATRDYEENFHARNASEAIPGRKEWYFPTVAIIQAIRHEIRSHDENSSVTWLAGYNDWRLMDRLQQLLVTANEIEFLMLNYRKPEAM
jgi:hypothetical protein